MGTNKVHGPPLSVIATSFWQLVLIQGLWPLLKGLQYFENLYVDGSFASFNQLHATFALNQSDFFRYFQLWDFVRSHSPTFPQILPSSGLDHILPALSKG